MTQNRLFAGLMAFALMAAAPLVANAQMFDFLRGNRAPEPPVAEAPMLAFPGALGWAATTPGGRGGRIIRVTTLISGDDAQASAWAPADWMLPAALITIALGFFGVLFLERLA